ncbi:DUF4139 domain-containing protein [Pararhizobium sp. BT-229]|uniref:DUF4139 domain-containing protein n=1 Tax=Pararhizobium sp. BT-229 TaxID=2986923 RepID=UPI0021F78B77|nr:DUF4139 domain-containing protein [Pararhizobium sp. BT-229]MCV9965129.1 DUF4139 domain-containing protein [Pararhizobium sp. BT-229]
MTKKILLSTVAALAMLQPLSAMADGFANSPVKSVTLSSGGLAEIRRTASLDGNGEIRIEVPLDQVNDLLKSLVVFDPKGTVKDLSLAGPNPLEETFKNLPFTPDDLTSLPKLLMSLKGSKVTIEGKNKGAGTILGVETEKKAEGAETAFLNLLADDGLISRYELDGSSTVKFDDPAVRAKIASAIGVVGNNVTDTARSVVVKIDGKGKRPVDFSYVVAAPIWKTSYRVVVGDDGKARLQAWAVLENATGEDWKNVGIVLNSSSPVTLTQRLHDRYWKHRDELPIVSDNVGIPHADTGNRALAKGGFAPAIQEMAAEAGIGFADAVAAAPSPEMAYAQSATASEGDISATFKLDGTYDIRNGDTVSVPIVDKEVAAELVSLFRPDRGDSHPISAVSLENTTGVSLPGGILTVYDSKGAYIGDSSLLGLPNGDTRMSSFALDKKVTVETKSDSGIKTVEIKVVDGVLVTKNVMREETVYVVHGAADSERTVLIEHPKRDGWEFTSPDIKGESATDYRLKVKVGKGETREVKAMFTRSGGESYQLADLNAADLAQWSSTSLDPVIKDKLSELSRAKKDEYETRRQLERAGEEHNALQASQERTRENLKVMPAGSDQQKEYVEKLSDIEKKIEQNEAAQTQMRETLSKFTSRVDDIIRTF